MLEKSLCYLDGKKDLWNRMLIAYPVKKNKELKNDELEMKAFHYWAMFVMEFCFSPDSIDGFDDIDIYELSLEDLDSMYHDVTHALLLMFFIDYGYHPRLANTFYRIKGYECGESFKDLGMYENFENKVKPHFIVRDLCILFSRTLKKSVSSYELLNLLVIIEACYKELLKYLKDEKQMREIDFELIQFGYGLDDKIRS